MPFLNAGLQLQPDSKFPIQEALTVNHAGGQAQVLRRGDQTDEPPRRTERTRNQARALRAYVFRDSLDFRSRGYVLVQELDRLRFCHPTLDPASGYPHLSRSPRRAFLWRWLG